MRRFLSLILVLLALISLCACKKETPLETPSKQEAVISTEFTLDAVKEVPPGEKAGENYSRYYDEFVGEFIASNKYGKIYPFIGRKTQGQEGNYIYDEERVGFCTQDGAIICDAVYGYRGTYHTKNHSYYLVRLVGMDEEYLDVGYLNINAGKFLFIRDDGKKVLEFYTRDSYGISAEDNRLVIYTGSNEYSYYNEDLEFVETKIIENLKKDTNTYVFNCPGCKKKVTADYLWNNFLWKKGEGSAIGYVHKDCNGKASLVSMDEELICTLPQTYSCGLYGLDEDYAWGYYYDSVEYAGDKLTGFIYDRKTDTIYTKPQGAFYVRLDDNKFYFQGQNYETEERYTYIYNIDNESVKYCDGIVLPGICVSYCEAGVSYVKDANLNEIMRIRITTD